MKESTVNWIIRQLYLRARFSHKIYRNYKKHDHLAIRAIVQKEVAETYIEAIRQIKRGIKRYES